VRANDDLSLISCRALWSEFLNSVRGRENYIDPKQVTFNNMVSSYYFGILFFAYNVLVLNYAFFLDYLTEADAKKAIPENALFYYVFDIRSSKLYCLIPVIIFFIILPAIFICFTVYSSEKMDLDFSGKIFENLNVFRKLHLNYIYNSCCMSLAKPSKLDSLLFSRVINYLEKKSIESRKILFVISFSLLSTTCVIVRVF